MKNFIECDDLVAHLWLYDGSFRTKAMSQRLKIEPENIEGYIIQDAKIANYLLAQGEIVFKHFNLIFYLREVQD